MTRKQRLRCSWAALANWMYCADDGSRPALRTKVFLKWENIKMELLDLGGSYPFKRPR